MSPAKPTVLILCTGNSCRSQMVFGAYADGRRDGTNASDSTAAANTTSP